MLTAEITEGPCANTLAAVGVSIEERFLVVVTTLTLPHTQSSLAGLTSLHILKVEFYYNFASFKKVEGKM